VKLLGIEFGTAWNASGARNFFCEGWPFHRWLGPLAPDFGPATFVAKTTTVWPRAGNMPLDGTTPRELAPRCIRVNFREAAVLNAVGLSGPGLAPLLADGRWQARTSPFLLSFMAVGDDAASRLSEAGRFARSVAASRAGFRAPFGVEVNVSCPNVGADHGQAGTEARAILSTLAHYLPGVPLVPKFNALVPVEVAREVAVHPDCAAVCVSNTIPWGSLPGEIPWGRLFGGTSPLAEFGGGGLSGAPIAPVVLRWVRGACLAGFPRPVVAGGGVVRARDAVAMLDAGASAVEVGSAAIVRPWRVRGIVRAIEGHSKGGN
jgi:dihydroorotate dehydrogenase (NAD+) catalytic subunit